MGTSIAVDVIPSSWHTIVAILTMGRGNRDVQTTQTAEQVLSQLEELGTSREEYEATLVIVSG